MVKPVRSNSKPYFGFALWLLLGVLLYFNTKGNGFTLDDETAITGNALVKKGMAGIPEICVTPYHYGYDQKEGGLYRPLSLVVLALEYEIFGPKPGSMHLIQALIYGILCMCVWRLCLLIFPKVNVWALIGGTALFVFHPIHTEVVSNLKSLDELLALLFLVLALHDFWKGKQLPAMYYRATFWFLLALFSKESSITYGGVFVLTFFFQQRNVKGIIKPLVIMFIPIVIFLMAMFSSVKGLETQGKIDVVENALLAYPDFWDQCAFRFILAGQYLRMLVIPYPLLHDYAFDHFGQPDFFRLDVFIFLSCIGTFIYFTWNRKTRWESLWVASLIFAPLLITSNMFFLIRWTFGERFLFSPSLGISMLGVMGLHWGITHRKWNLTLIQVFMGAVALVFFVLIVQRNQEWKNNATLFKADLSKSPRNIRILSLLAKTESDEARLTGNVALMQSAIGYFERAKDIRQVPEFIDGLAACYADIQQFDKAIFWHKRALELKPGMAQVWHNLGNAYRNAQKKDSAFWAYHQALAYIPDYDQSLPNLANLHFERKQWDSAIYYGRKAIQKTPDELNFRRNLSLYFESAGMADSASFYQVK